MNIKYFTTISVLVIISAFSACQKSATDDKNFSPSLTISQTASPALTPEINSPIKKIDFKNFKYPFTEFVGDFTLKNGEKPYVHQKESGIALYKIDYADVNNDGEEDAIIFMSVQTGGSAIPNVIYIYSLQNNKPKLLWSFMTGDRAVGGLKNIYKESDTLIVELFGDNKFINDEWKFNPKYEKYAGDGSLTIYTKTRFKWNGEKFIVEGKPELFDIPESNKPNLN